MRNDWMARAACVGRWWVMDVEVGDGQTRAGLRYELAQAEAVCRYCPVLAECRVWADEVGQVGFVAGEFRDRRWWQEKRYRERPPGRVVERRTHVVGLRTPTGQFRGPETTSERRRRMP